ncbi:hypothetical protein KJ940_15185 [Myxococcota bacterium]|nr:hypothetical protein [Myxococcota bacterium]
MSRRTFSFAEEAAFGAIQAGSPLPNRGGLSFLGVLCDRAEIKTHGEPILATRDEARIGYHKTPDTYITLHDEAGEPIPRRKGQVTITMRGLLLGDGTVEIPNYSAHALAKMLGASLGDGGDPLAGGDVVTVQTAGAPGSQTFAVADATGLKVGELLRAFQDGLASYTAITKIDGSEITISPALKKDLADADTLRRMRNFIIPKGSITPGKSLAFREDGKGWRTEAYGCRWSKLDIKAENGEVLFTFTFEAPYIRDHHDDAEVQDGTNLKNYAVPAGPSTKMLGGLQVISLTPSNAAGPGAKLGAQQMNLDDWSLSITATLAQKGRSDTILASSDQEVVDFEVELNATLSSPLDLLSADLRKGQERSVLIGFGVAGPGTGMAIYIPSAILTVDPELRDLGAEYVRQALKWKMGLCKLDDETGGVTNVEANSAFRLGLGL